MTTTMLPLFQGPSCTFVLPLVALLNVGWPAVSPYCGSSLFSCSLTLDNLIKHVAKFHSGIERLTNASTQPVPHLPIRICREHPNVIV